jgi:hypothetical protein
LVGTDQTAAAAEKVRRLGRALFDAEASGMGEADLHPGVHEPLVIDLTGDAAEELP